MEEGDEEGPPSLDVADVLRETLRAIAAHPLGFLAVSTAMAIPMVVSTFAAELAAAAIRGAGVAGLYELLFGAIAVLALAIARVAVQAVGQAVILETTIGRFTGRDPSVLGSLRSVLPRTLPIFGTSFLFWLAVVFGALCCFVPGIVAFLWLCLALPVCVVEKLGPIDSFQRSVELTEGNRLAVSVVMLVALGPLVLLPTCALGFASRAVGLADLTFTTLSIQVVLLAAARMVVYTIMSLLMPVVVGVVYARLRGLRPAVDAGELAKVFA